MSGKPMSTLAFEKRFNRLLGLPCEEAFVAAVAADLPARPADMETLLRRNRGRG